MSSSNILLAYGNKAPGATLAGGSWDSTLTLNNIKTRKLAQVARSTNTSIYNTQFRFDLAANYTLRALALVNHNLTTGARWRARTTAATMDMDFVGPTSMKPVTLTTSGGANGTRFEVDLDIDAGAQGGALLSYNDKLYAGVGINQRGIVLHRYGKPDAAGIAATFEMEIDVEIRSIFDVLVNHEAQSDGCQHHDEQCQRQSAARQPGMAVA